MKLETILSKVSATLGAIKVGGKARSNKLAALDRGVLTVAMLLAGLDGTILPCEYAAFQNLAKKCRGFTEKNARALLDQAISGAGYLMAMAQVGSYTESERLKAFVNLAIRALPDGFDCGSMADLRRAFALWVAMGISDGSFSDIEHQAIESLAARYADIRFEKALQIEAINQVMCPVVRQYGGSVTHVKHLALLEPEFFTKAEKIMREIAIPSKSEKAAIALDALISNVELAAADGSFKTRTANTISLKR